MTMSRSDRQLGMSRDITRRDFVHGMGLAALGLGLPSGAPGEQPTPPPADVAGRIYPPTLTGPEAPGFPSPQAKQGLGSSRLDLHRLGEDATSRLGDRPGGLGPVSEDWVV